MGGEAPQTYIFEGRLQAKRQLILWEIAYFSHLAAAAPCAPTKHCV